MTASIREAKAKLSNLVASAERGEEVIITSHGKPRAKLVPVSPSAGRKLDIDKIRRIAKKARTGKRFCLDSTQLISDDRDNQ
jgi:prevent-host-death family protein